MINMSDVLRLTRAGRLREATAAIQRLLGRRRAPSPDAGREESANAEPAGTSSPGVQALRQFDRTAGAVEPKAGKEPYAGEFIEGRYAGEFGARTYKLYVPGSHGENAGRPLVVMLHGCQQTPDDFAAGTNMNRLAEENGCFVLYPGQARSANVANCWNWFKESDQHRGQGEPAILAGMTQKIVAEYGIDARRVYIAGLSAGGAMAAVMVKTYPDIYAAVGIHSGLPYGAARDVQTAFEAMRGISTGHTRSASPPEGDDIVPVIVFHGDQDKTVHPGNGAQIAREQLEAISSRASGIESKLARTTEHGSVAQGHAYTRSRYIAPDGSTVIEQWEVHGGGHGWSGGSPAGSFTDARGPDASAAMLRFFLNHALPGVDR